MLMINNDYTKYFISKLLIGFMSMYLVILYSNYYEPDTFGQYSLIIGVVHVFISLSIGWITSAISRYLEVYKENLTQFIINVLKLFLVLISLSLIVMLLFFTRVNFVSIKAYYLSIIGLFITTGFVMIFDKLLLASRRSNDYSVSKLLQGGTNLLLLYLLYTYVDQGINSLFLSIILSNTLFIVINFIRFKIKLSDFIRYKSDKDMFMKLFRYGWPLMLLWGLSWMLNLSDRYIIKLFFENAQVGIYDMNYRVSKHLIELFTVPLSMTVFPIMVATWTEKGLEATKTMLVKSIEMYLYIVLPACLGLIAIRNLLFDNLLSVNYKEGSIIILYVSIGIVLSGLTQILYRTWKLREDTKSVLKLTIFTVVVNMTLNFIMIPRWGYISAAVSTMLAYIMAFVLAFYLVNKEFKLQFNWKTLIKIFIAAFMMYILISLVSTLSTGIVFLLLVIVLGVIVYVFMLFILKLLKPALATIKDVLKNR